MLLGEKLTNPNSHAILKVLKRNFHFRGRGVLEPLRFDISKPCIGIITSKKILPFIKQEPAFQPASETPSEILKSVEKSLVNRYEGFFLNPPGDFPEAYITSVITEDDQARLNQLSICPFPYEVLSNILPLAFTGSFWKEKLVWGCILYPDNESCILLLGTYEDCDVKVERKGNCIRIAAADTLSADQCPAPTNLAAVEGLIKLIRDSLK